MKIDATLRLIVLLESLRPAGPRPNSGNPEEHTIWIYRIQNNLHPIIAFTSFELKKMRSHPADDWELYVALSRTEKQASESFRLTKEILRAQDQQKSRQIDTLQSNYDTLRASVGMIVLLTEPTLAVRAEVAF